jgi:hypothetical protein
LPAGKNVSTEADNFAGVCHQATAGEDTAGWEELVRALVNCKVCEFAIAL